MSSLNQFKLGTQLYIKLKQFLRKMHDSYTYIQIKKTKSFPPENVGTCISKYSKKLFSLFQSIRFLCFDSSWSANSQEN